MDIFSSVIDDSDTSFLLVFSAKVRLQLLHKPLNDWLAHFETIFYVIDFIMIAEQLTMTTS